jgi:hypothetical protein
MCNARRPSYRFTLGAFRPSRVVLDFLPGAAERARASLRRKAQGYAIKRNTHKAPALFTIGNGVATMDLRDAR